MVRHPWVLVAAAIAVLGAMAHSYLGERYLLTRLFRRPDLPRLFGDATFTKGTLRFTWHLCSVAWLGFAALLTDLGTGQNPSARSVAATIALTLGASGVLPLVCTRGRHLSWLGFFVAAFLAWFGLRER